MKGAFTTCKWENPTSQYNWATVKAAGETTVKWIFYTANFTGCQLLLNPVHHLAVGYHHVAGKIKDKHNFRTFHDL